MGRPAALAGLAGWLLVVVLHLGTDLVAGLERRLYDLGNRQTERPASERIAVIAIDDVSIANIGRWPWPREVHARLIDQLTEAGARTIVHTALFLEPQNDRGLDTLRALRERLEDPSAAVWTDLGPRARQGLLAQIDEAERSLDGDNRLRESLARSGRVLLPAVYTLGTPVGPPDQPLPATAQRSALPLSPELGWPAQQSQQPLPLLAEAASGIGHLNQLPDRDGVVRHELLLLGFDGHLVPSLALLTALHSLNLRPSDVQVTGEGLRMGSRTLPTDRQGRLLPQFYPERTGRPAFTTDAFFDVYSGRIVPSKYAGKIVVIGATAAGVGTLSATPAGVGQSPAELVAHTTSSLLEGHFFARPPWTGPASLVALALVAVYLALVLPALRASAAAALTGALFLVLLLLPYGLLVGSHIWWPLVWPATALMAGYLALITQRFWVTEARKRRSDEESAETNRQMGLALMGQGQLDQAFDRLRRVPRGEALMDNLRQLAQDFERKRQFAKAESVYEHMAQLDQGNADWQQRLQRARDLTRTQVLGGAGPHPGGTLILDGEGVEKPMLGRYRVEKTLGKGAMGMVYQGRDPRIGRVVAIKTLALSAEFEGLELQEARERFFREAETAGRLQHPNIVTIFDAGEEHDLAYIAMEFLAGTDLLPVSRPGHLLPADTVLSIGARVARALDHAHRQQVIHRDIKPGNIMYDPVTDSVKVTDFGIARITDASRTRTGVVLGTPSFMSPEQLAGQPLDGRSDLYSLGATLYQLLTGDVPLKAESMAALMYRIAHDAPADLRQRRPELPAALARLLAALLAKAPQDRPASGAELADALERLRAELPPESAPATGAPAGQAPVAPDAYAATERLPGQSTREPRPENGTMRTTVPDS
jgi:CHASE2 domain-containing sensor protein